MAMATMCCSASKKLRLLMLGEVLTMTMRTCFDSRMAGKSENGADPTSQATRNERARISAPRSSSENEKRIGSVVALDMPKSRSSSIYWERL